MNKYPISYRLDSCIGSSDSWLDKFILRNRQRQLDYAGDLFKKFLILLIGLFLKEINKAANENALFTSF